MINRRDYQTHKNIVSNKQLLGVSPRELLSDSYALPSEAIAEFKDIYSQAFKAQLTDEVVNTRAVDFLSTYYFLTKGGEHENA